jgi:hypothetical protein
MNARLFGTLCVVGSVLGILGHIAGAAQGLDGASAEDYISIVGISLLAWLIGGALCVSAMIYTNVVGTGTVSRFLAFTPVVAFAVLFIAQLVQFFTGDDPGLLIVLGWVLYMVGVLMLGILTIAAKTWHGWRRFMPLVCFLLALLPLADLGRSLGSIFWTAWIPFAPWIAIGYAVTKAQDSPVIQHSPA